MSIASALTALQTDITNARTAITTKGGTVTSGGGSSQLATDIASIPSGGGVPTITFASSCSNSAEVASYLNAMEQINFFVFRKEKTTVNRAFLGAQKYSEVGNIFRNENGVPRFISPSSSWDCFITAGEEFYMVELGDLIE